MTVNAKEFEELRNQVEMLFGFLVGKKILSPEDVANIINESKKTDREILE